MAEREWGRFRWVTRVGKPGINRGSAWALVAAVASTMAASCDDGSSSHQGRTTPDGGIDGDAGDAAGRGASGGAPGGRRGLDSGVSASGRQSNAHPDAGIEGGAGKGPTLPACAGALDRTHATSFYEAAKCLFEGDAPPQRSVKAGAIDAQRFAIVRGAVRDDSGAALSGVRVSILNHDELGETTTRADGYFDLAVNGGAMVTVVYGKAGYLSAERHLTPGWREFAVFPDVVLKTLSPKATKVDLGASASTSVVEGDVSDDASGKRHEVLVVTPGTMAKMVMPDGSKKSLGSFNVHVTEYTVGDYGAAAMPADLPPTSGYTYAVDYTVDEATAAGAARVDFDPPVASYVENFLGFPVGTTVPRGAFDPATDTWQPYDNGVVLKILSVDGGNATVDTDGDDKPDDDAALSKIGISSAELSVLADRYSAGTTLWRVLVPHFSAWDSNWGFGPPPDAGGPFGGIFGGGPTQCQEQDDGSIIGCEGQTLGERIAIPGTPFALRYQSERVAGRTDANQVNIVLSGSNLPGSVKQIVLDAEVLGQEITRTYDPKPNLTDTVDWDGLDAYGRAWQGRQTMYVRVGYVYDGVYEQTPRFGSHGNGIPITGDHARRTVTLWSSYQTQVGAIDVQPLGLAGWMLDAQHFYDMPSGTLYLGDGSTRSADALGPIITTVAGGHGFGSGGDGGMAKDASITVANGLAVGPDGSYYFSESAASQASKIWKVTPNGKIATIAGAVASGFDGDGGPATAAHLANPAGLALLPDGTLLVADSDNNRVRSISPGGTIDTFAGNGNAKSDGDGGPATRASVDGPVDVAVAPDGSVYVAEQKRVRRISPDGAITTAAGNGKLTVFGDGDGAAAVDAAFATIAGISVDASGVLYIADKAGGRVRAVGTDGIVRPFFGGGKFDIATQPVATDAQSNGPRAVFANRDGRVFVAQTCSGLNVGSEIAEVTPDGHARHFAGCGPDKSPYGENGPAATANFQGALGIGSAPDGSLYFGASGAIHAIHPTLERFSTDDVLIASSDGRSVFVFDAQGRHLRTMDARTGAAKYSFDYDSGLLSSVTDAYGNVTQFQRDSANALTAIVGPYGAKTKLSVGDDGFLSKLEDPNGQATTFTYSAGGLLATLVGPRSSSYVHSFEYDSLGRLTKDAEASGAAKKLARTDNADGSYRVSLATSLGGKALHDVDDADPANLSRTVTSPDGVKRTLSRTASGTTFTTPAASRSTRIGGDPRFGLQAPVLLSSTTTETGGPTSTVTEKRSATLSDPTDLLSATMLVDENTVNDQTWTTTWDGSDKTEARTSPEGRTTTSTLNAQGDITRQQPPGADPVIFAYDDHGHPVSIGQSNQSTTLGYDSVGNLSSVTDPLGDTETSDYDKTGRRIARHHADGTTVKFAYDAAGNLTSVTPPGKPAHVFTYDADERVASYTAPDAGSGPTITTYSYDADGNPTTIAKPDATVTLGYDSAGRVSSVAFPNGSTTIGYDAMTGHIASIDGPYGAGLKYSYSGDLLATTTWTGTVTGSVSRTYDDFFRVTTETVDGSGSAAATFAYNDDGLIVSATSGTSTFSLTYDAQAPRLTGTTLGAISDAFTYDSRGLVATYTAKYNSTGLYDVTYTRDALGRIQSRTETIQGGKTTTEYAYDKVGRLVSVAENGTIARSYDYDDNGNRTKLSDAGKAAESTGTYDAQDRLLSYGKVSYSYTPDGALKEKSDASTNPPQTTSYTYDMLGNLVHVELPDRRALDYVIDAEGRRVGKKVDGVLQKQWLYADASRIVAELDGAGNVVSRFVWADGIGTEEDAVRSVFLRLGLNVPVSDHEKLRDIDPRRPLKAPAYIVRGGSVYRITTDHLGTPRLITNALTGVVAQRLDADEWGKVLTDTAPGFQPFGFAAGLYDTDTGLVRFGARDYDATVGRWTSKDPILFKGGQANIYVYIADDPINRSDVNGRDRATCQAGAGLSGIFDCLAGCGLADLTVGPGAACNIACGLFFFWAGYQCSPDATPPNATPAPTSTPPSSSPPSTQSCEPPQQPTCSCMGSSCECLPVYL